jgi:hypothetical protein
MSQIKPLLAVIVLVLGLALSGCGDKNPQLINTEEGSHPADWLQNHWGAAKSASTDGSGSAASLAGSSCVECHGADLNGGISNVSCFSVNREAQICHAEGPSVKHSTGWKLPSQHGSLGAIAKPGVSTGLAYCAKCHSSNFNGKFNTTVSISSCVNNCHKDPDNVATASPHPAAPWHGTTTGTNHAFADPGNADQCAKCHDNINSKGISDLQPSPSAAAAAAGKAPGCFNNTLCHATDHPADFKTYSSYSPNRNSIFHGFLAAKTRSSCKNCHGGNLQGGTAPNDGTPTQPCSKCHTAFVPDDVKASGCISCHANLPKGPDGSAFPNRSSSHGKHVVLPNVTCDACHNGGGHNTSNHAKGTPWLAILPTFKAKQGNVTTPADPVHNADGTCANVSCHGGNPTPVWGQSIVSFAQAKGFKNGKCDACHQQGSAKYFPEYNNFFTAEHASHLLKTNPGTTSLITCTNCHDTQKLTTQLHYSGLKDAHAFKSPGETVGGGSTRLSPYVTSTQTCNGITCHSFGGKLGAPQNNIHWF